MSVFPDHIDDISRLILMKLKILWILTYNSNNIKDESNLLRILYLSSSMEGKQSYL